MASVSWRPSSLRIRRIASRNGWPSMSPTVPPTSTMTTWAPESRPIWRMRSLISLVTCGIGWVGWPRWWAQGAGWACKVGVELLDDDGDAAGLEEPADGGGCDALAY